MHRVDHSGPTPLAKRLCAVAAMHAFLGAGAPALAADSACPDAPESFATVDGVSDDLALSLSDGRKIRLAGIETPRATAQAPSRPQDVREMLQMRLKGTTVGLAPLGPSDRWQAIPAIVFTDDGTLASSLLSQGVVRVQPDRAAKPCRENLLRAETIGRRATGSAWQDPALEIVDADAIVPYGTPSQAMLDGLAVVEGKVASVGETPARLYLNLGHRRGGFAVSLPKRDRELMASDAIRRARAVGVRLRVRGLIDRHTGLRIDVSDADAIEILGSDSGEAAPQSP